MSVDDFVKLILGVAGAVSILGISIQLMRLLGTLNTTLQDFQYITRRIAVIVDKVAGDYEKFKDKVKGVLSPLTMLNENFVVPLMELTSVVGVAIKAIKERIIKF
jgi:hypothetical protein